MLGFSESSAIQPILGVWKRSLKIRKAEIKGFKNQVSKFSQHGGVRTCGKSSTGGIRARRKGARGHCPVVPSMEDSTAVGIPCRFSTRNSDLHSCSLDTFWIRP